MNDSEVAKLSKRFQEGGTQWHHVQTLAEEWYKPMMRRYATIPLAIGVRESLRGHRPLRMQERRHDDRYDALNSYIRSKTDPPRVKTSHPADNRPVNEFAYFLQANGAKFLWSAIEARNKTESHPALVASKKSHRKPRLVAALLRAFGCVDGDGADEETSPSEALAAFKAFCNSAEPVLQYKAPKKPWTADMTQDMKAPKPTLAQALASAPSEEKSIELLSALAWNPDLSPFNSALSV